MTKNADIRKYGKVTDMTRRYLLIAGLLLSILLVGCRRQEGTGSQQKETLKEVVSQAESAVSAASEAAKEAASQAESAAAEAKDKVSQAAEQISQAKEQLSQAGEQLSQAKEQLTQTGGEIASLAAEAVEAAQSEDGSFDPEGLKTFGKQLYDTYVAGGDAGFSGLDALLAKVDAVNAAEKSFVLGRNAVLMKPGDVRIIAGGNVYSEDFSDLTEFQEIYDAIQYNYNKDGNTLRFVDKNDEVILFSFREEEDGKITITDSRFAEKGEKEAADLAAMCEELGADYEEAADMLAFNRAYDVDALMDYMRENPDITGIEYEGQVRTYEELDEIGTQRLKELYPEDFAE